MTTNTFDEQLRDLDRSVVNMIRTVLGVSGLLALVIGVLVLVWPVKTGMVVAGIIAVYAGIAGLVNIAVGILSRRLGVWPRIGYLLLGALFLVAAVVTFMNLGTATTWLAALVGVTVGIVWIVEGIVGLTLVRDAASKAWTIISSLISIVAGILVVTSPVWGAAVLWLLLGVSLVAVGVVQLVRAFRFGAV